jgi:hypothetical protein
MPVTPTYSLPYPQDSDPVDVAGDLQALAEAVDTAIAAGGGGSSGGAGYPDIFLLMGA